MMKSIFKINLQYRLHRRFKAFLLRKCLINRLLKAPKLFLAGNTEAGKEKTWKKTFCARFVPHTEATAPAAFPFYGRKVKESQGYGVLDHTYLTGYRY